MPTPVLLTSLTRSAAPAVSVVIVSFNTRDLLRRCLRSLDPAPPSLEIVVIDNASRDGSPEMVEDDFPHVRLIRADKNLGFGPANNAAIAAATGRYVLLLNSDAFANVRTIERAVELMDADPKTAIGGAQLLNADGSEQTSARQFPSLPGYFWMVTGLAHRHARWDDAQRLGDVTGPVGWIVGAFLMIRRDVLNRLGGFDPRFFLYYEEVDLCLRAARAGFQSRLFPELRVVHLGGESAKTVNAAQMCDFSPQLTLWSMRSALLYFRKNHGWQAWGVLAIEGGWHFARAAWNRLRGGARRAKSDQSRRMVSLIRQAWRETRGGRVSPPQPW